MSGASQCRSPERSGPRFACCVRTNCATAMSAIRWRRSFTRQRATSVRIAGGTSSGSAFQSGSLFSTLASVSATSSPSKCACAGQHLVEHTAKRPDVAAFVRRAPLGLLGAHVRRRAENHPDAGHHGGCRDGRRLRDVRRAAGRLHRLCQAEVEHLDGAVGADLDVGGLEVAVDDALLVRGFERLGDLLSRSAALRRSESPRARSAASRSSPSTSSMTRNAGVVPAGSSRP